MLNIDGSVGEGGGQLVRNAIALSAISGIPITITRIRANRKNPGLAAQHIAAVSAVASTCDAECRGVTLRSDGLEFIPHEPVCRTVSVDIGTAGSIPLVMQAWLPVALHIGGTLHIRGGTEVSRSPTIDYFDHLFAAVLRSAGADIRIRVLQRGYFPHGGGEVEITVNRKKISPIVPASNPERGCRVFSCSSNLPNHVTERQASAAATVMESACGVPCPTTLDSRTGPGTGSSVTVVMGTKGGISLGRRGLPAEEVGRIAARALMAEMKCAGTVDSHLSDQILVPLALYGGHFSTSSMTSHASTVCDLLGRFGYEIRVSKGNVVEYAT